ncbi:MAG: ACT domain-containing protein [Lentisphaerota bacterium]
MNKALHSVAKGKQISVFLDDKPGMLAGITELLGRHGVNIYALSLAEGIGHGYVRMVVDKEDEAISTLRDANELVLDREVLLLELSNKPGSLGLVTRLLAESGVNLEYAYCAGGRGVDKGLVIVKVDDTDNAMQVLQKSSKV